MNKFRDYLWSGNAKKANQHLVQCREDAPLLIQLQLTHEELGLKVVKQASPLLHCSMVIARHLKKQISN
ncbi:hypothetical protein PoB_002251300 [Plakobranchus ocellatus]|uniref:Uncharacterized protein n=1 Tax=Plakobranchus ocellatus TaxID=259542 RepID=A0AAV3ZNE7_9GAST|nr:hypothetical protein PoB_002251300 [Plakobranchus ocellatus]